MNPDTAGRARSVEEHLELVADADAYGTFATAKLSSRRHAFGGRLVGQALRAAQLTVVQPRLPHSLHASFVRAGDARQSIRYEAERTRDGTSFATRRVVARQGSHVVLVLTASFQDDEEGPVYEPPRPVEVPGPEGLPVGRYATDFFDSRDVPVPPGDTGADFTRRSWFRSRVPLPDDPALHLQALAYLSDHGPTRAVRQPHADHPGLERRMSVSLDHSVWFHRRVRVDDWLLSELAPRFTGGGRGLAVGTVRTAEGVVVATIAQETLLRLPG